MRKLLYVIIGMVFLTMFSCQQSEIQELKMIQNEEIVPENKAQIRGGHVVFGNLADFRKTVLFMIENPEYSFESMDGGFESFQSGRLELEKLDQRPSEELFQKYFREIVIEGEKEIFPRITDNVFERIVNSEGIFEIQNELYNVKDDILFKKDLNLEESEFSVVSQIKVDVQRSGSNPNPQLRAVNGGGYFRCGRKDYRLLGDLVNFNIGIYQRLSVQVKYQRKNKSFWSWLNPWLNENGSLSYNANFTLQPSGGIPAINVNLNDNCGSCSGFNRTVDWNIGAAGPTQWSNQSGTFGGTTACGYKSF